MFSILRLDGSVRALKQEVVSHGGRLVSISLDEKRDETPMCIATIDYSAIEQLAESGLAEFAELKDFATPEGRDRAPSKLLRTQLGLTLLVYMQGRYITLSYDVITPLQSMGRTTGEVYFESLRVLMSIIEWDELSDGFEFKYFNKCSDGAIVRIGQALFTLALVCSPLTLSFSLAQFTTRSTVFFLLSDRTSCL